jgi:hypothetical protein
MASSCFYSFRTPRLGDGAHKQSNQFLFTQNSGGCKDTERSLPIDGSLRPTTGSEIDGRIYWIDDKASNFAAPAI